MPFEALVGVVEDYPWFGAAQKTLCERTVQMGGRDLARDMFAAAALQVASRRKIISMLRPDTFSGVSLLRDYTFSGVPAGVGGPVPVETHTETQNDGNESDTSETEGDTNQPESAMTEGVNKNYRGAGDYFSREQYERVRMEAREASAATTPSETASNADSFNLDRDVSLDGFYTEALAEIYAEQGYFERAKDIYSKLILAEPEKNTYFASLIEKLNEKN